MEIAIRFQFFRVLTVVALAATLACGNTGNTGKSGSGAEGSDADVCTLKVMEGAVANDFGLALAVSGDVMVVSAGGSFAVGRGSAFIYREDDGEWELEEMLFASDIGVADDFGRSVAAFGDRVVVGAPTLNAAYVYRWIDSEWILEQEIRHPPAEGTGYIGFAFSVAITDDVLVASANVQNAVYIYRFDGTQWVHEQKIATTSGRTSSQFGATVLAAGDSILVGAPADREVIPNGGAIHAFEYDGDRWVEYQKIAVAAEGEATRYYSFLGGQMATDGTVLVARTHTSGDVEKCHVYRKAGETWHWEADFISPDPSEFIGFCITAAVRGNTILVGALNDDDLGEWSGSATVFRYSEGTLAEDARLTAEGGVPFDRFGRSVGISENAYLIGATGHTEEPADGSSRGAVYVIRD
jgi:hypothetical protein